ncbi:MAG: hypothetical protein IKK58_05570 [Clostridia bacterium]|nr:hypothetical protein [Clostridia bacterium]
MKKTKLFICVTMLLVVALLSGCNNYTEIREDKAYESWQEYRDAASVDNWTDEVPPPDIYYYVLDDLDYYESAYSIEKIVINDSQVQVFMRYPYWSIIVDRDKQNNDRKWESSIQNGAELKELQDGNQYAVKKEIIQGEAVVTYYFIHYQYGNFMTVQCRKDITEQYNDEFIVREVVYNNPRLPDSLC